MSQVQAKQYCMNLRKTENGLFATGNIQETH